jgi:hypothetical protein
MTDPTPAAGGLTDHEVQRLEDASWKGGRQAWLAEVAAIKADAADRELARVKAAVEALADEWCTEGPSLVAHAHGARDVHEGSTLEKCARDLRAALSSADTTALDDLLDRERAKAAGEALREAADAGPSSTATDQLWRMWLRNRAAAVSPEGGDA